MDPAKTSTVPLEASPIKVRMKAMNTPEQHELSKPNDNEEMPPPPPPAAVKPAQPKVVVPVEDEKRPKYSPGVLIWAKMTGHPYWPCMVTDDPLQGIFSRVTARGQRLYHCQFFGTEAERGWVSESTTLEYQGRDNFLKFVETQINSAGTKGQKKQANQKYEIKAGRRQAWDISARSADQALTIKDVDERRRLYTFQYRDLPVASAPSPVSTITSQPTSPSPVVPMSQPTPAQKRKKPSPKEPVAKKVKPVSAGPISSPKATFTTVKKNPPKLGSKGATDGDGRKVFLDLDDPFAFDEPDITTPPAARVPAPKFPRPVQSSPGPLKSILGSTSILQDSAFTMQDSALATRDSALVMQSSAPVTSSSTSSIQRSTPAVRGSATSTAGSALSMANSALNAAVSKFSSSNVAPTTSVASGMHTRRTSSSSSGPRPSDNRVKEKKSSDSSFSSPSRPKPTNKPQPVDMKIGDSAPLPTTFEIFKLTANSSVRKEGVCALCERDGRQKSLGELVNCTGSCQNSFHTTCASVIDKDTFKCQACTTGEHACFICKQQSGVVQKCSFRDCGRFYHKECIASHPLALVDDVSMECSLHACASCARGDKTNAKARVGKLYKCMRCPTSFHSGDFCISAGSKVVAGLHIICCNHLNKEKKTTSHQTHLNVNWCFYCSLGGTLVCCETCPAAFHLDCLSAHEKPKGDGAWFCNDCKYGIRPRYGDIVWVKLGSYRWWPSEICHPEHVPKNIQMKPHDIGEFAVHFFGSNDYNWLNRGRVFRYQEGDKGSKEPSTKNLNKMFKLALEQASEGYTQLTLIRQNKDQVIAKMCDSKPRRYKYIKVNLPIPPVKLNKVDKEQISVCECSPEMEYPCGDNDMCLNRMLYYECHPATCPCGDKCQNQRFQRRRYPKQEPFRTGDERGWGLKARTDIKKGEFVNEYVGELITDEECKRRIQKYHDENSTTFYMLTLDSNRVIDAGPKGNLARFANHSCEPNMKTQKWYVNGNWRVGLFAVQDISRGTELTFNYNLVSVGEKKLKCLCKAPSCSGFIGERTVKPPNSEKIVKPKKVKKRHPKLKHDDWCFRCLDGGELLMCNRKNCTRAYHLSCLGLPKVPYGKWDCPWHHCDDCGKAATILCSECPNSFCNQHHSRNIQQIQGSYFCRSHTPNDITKILAAREMEPKTVQINSAPSTPGSTTSTDASVDGINYMNALGTVTGQPKPPSSLLR